MSLTVERIADGLWQWSVARGCGTYAETPAALFLIDPPLPTEGSPDSERFWHHLDRDVTRTGRAVFVLLTRAENRRSSERLVERYGAALWSPSQTNEALPDSDVQIIWPAGAPGRVAAFFLPTHRALVVDRSWKELNEQVGGLEIAHLLRAHVANAVGDSTQD